MRCARTLRAMLDAFVNTELPEDARRPHARAQGDRRGDRRGAALLPAASAHLDHGQPAVQHVARRADHARLRAGCSAPGPIWRPSPIRGARRCCSPWRRGPVSVGAAGSDRRRLRGSAVLRLRPLGPGRRALRHARPSLAPVRAVGALRGPLHHEHGRLAGDRAARAGRGHLAHPQDGRPAATIHQT